MRSDKFVLLAIVLCAIVLAGELMAYGPSMHRYDADADLVDGNVMISVTSSGTDTFSAVIMDNSAHPAPTQLYIYLDERYDESFEEAEDAAGLKSINMEYSIDQMCRSLRIRGFDNILICNDGQLLEAMAGDAEGTVSKGLLVMSYALPESIYSGSDGDLLFRWIEGGGYLYWMTSPIGMFSRGENGIEAVESSQELFFGKDCMNTDDNDTAMSVIDGDGLTAALALKWNHVLYGIDVSDMAGTRSMGFSQDGYSGVSMIPFGSGMICVVGGNYDRYQCDDASQIIASGVSCYSVVLGTVSGTVTRGTTEALFGIPEDADGISAYISIGGYYVTFGRALNGI